MDISFFLFADNSETLTKADAISATSKVGSP